MKEYLHESKKVLVNNGILKPGSLQKNHIVLDAHEAKNYDWRYLCIARMFDK
jgi:asparagine synthase (glutamine-hydrolysing)